MKLTGQLITLAFCVAFALGPAFSQLLPDLPPEESGAYTSEEAAESSTDNGYDIDPFSYEFEEYDSSLDPKYIEEDHNLNQSGLKDALKAYLRELNQLYQAELRIAGIKKSLFFPLDAEDKKIAEDCKRRYDREVNGANATYDQLRLSDDIAYRAALSKSTREKKRQEEEEAERRRKVEEEHRKQQEANEKKQRDLYNGIIAKNAAKNAGDDAIDDIESYIEENTLRRRLTLIPPEEYAPQRKDYHVPQDRVYAAIEPDYRDQWILDQALTASEKPTHVNELSPAPQVDNTRCDSLKAVLNRLSTDWNNLNNPEVAARIDSILIQLKSGCGQGNTK